MNGLSRKPKVINKKEKVHFTWVFWKVPWQKYIRTRYSKDLEKSQTQWHKDSLSATWSDAEKSQTQRYNA